MLDRDTAPGAHNAKHQKMAVRQAMVTREWLASSGFRLKRFDLVGTSSPSQSLGLAKALAGVEKARFRRNSVYFKMHPGMDNQDGY